MAKMYTSADVECCFSKCDLLLTPQHTRLAPETLHILEVCTKT